MKEKIRLFMGIGSLCLFLFGCSKNQIVVEADSLTDVTTAMEEENAGEGAAEENARQEQAATEERSSQESVKMGETPKSDENPASCTEKETEETEKIVVHICGAVHQPGVYTLDVNARIYDGLLQAGGFREDAEEEYLNLAQPLEDGMKITVPTKEEAIQWQQEENLAVQGLQTGNTDDETAAGNEKPNSKVDLNTASESELCTLPGIGESRAKSIVDYRKEHGRFETIEDIMKVSGIKEAAYEKLKDYVTVS